MNRFYRFNLRYRKKDLKKSFSSHRLVNILISLIFLILLSFLIASPLTTFAQSEPDVTPIPGNENAPVEAPNEVKVIPIMTDDEIGKRLQTILESTGWYQNPEVTVKEGIVYLNGETETEDNKLWAEELARNTQDVVAVVNRIELIRPSVWDFQPAMTELWNFWVGLIRAIPLIILSLLILAVTWVMMRIGMKITRNSLRRHLDNHLLSNVVAYIVGSVIFLIGVYIILQIAGLTGAATAVVGGTGLLGLVLGIAFRDISENFLASIFLSVQNPFHTNDLVQIDGVIGYIQALTIRVTILMTIDGVIVQIPNATVYKSHIYNYSSNPNRRADFIIGIGYQESVSKAQKIALAVMKEHPAVLKDPEPFVVVENLGSSTINLHIYFWLDSQQNSLLKVKSSVMHQVEQAFQAADILMPDEAREVIFPEGIPVHWIKSDSENQPSPISADLARQRASEEKESIAIETEAKLYSEAKAIQEQARHARILEDGKNLLKSTDSSIE